MTREQNKAYECIFLNKKVVLELKYESIPGIFETLTGFNCRHACLECGVVTKSGSYDWKGCPAARNYTV